MMLTRIARGLYSMGRLVERTQHVTRVLEVNHKMNLERASVDESKVWRAISEAFGCDLEVPDEAELYGELVLSTAHPFSVKRCIEAARDEGRSMRDHISEEMWLHLNRTHLDLAPLEFSRILRIGRSEFNRQIEIFGDALYGLAADTMIRGESWSFLQVGKFAERALMICRILEIKRKTLSLSPEMEGAPLDVHQWQVLLRCLSGYEPYRRVHDARILPERVLAFALQRPDFPRSLSCTLGDLRLALAGVAGGGAAHLAVTSGVDALLTELARLDPQEILRRRSLEAELARIEERCEGIVEELEVVYFTSSRPASVPIAAAPGAGLVPQ